MSFSFTATVTVGDDVEAALDAAAAAVPGDQTRNAEALGMLGPAKAYAASLVPAIARPGDVVAISVYGHANPSAEPNPGWASNCVTVGLSQAYSAKEA